MLYKGLTRSIPLPNYNTSKYCDYPVILVT
nr:MAG TPA: hypothetical protein [Caudoviricetes sp.]DAI58414.1 MAG TPA: hypothetical protein [Crassvirales sp.]